MEQIWDKVVKGVALAVGAISGFLGGWSLLLTVMVAMMTIDYISGVLVALMGKSTKTEYGGLCSKVGAQGLAKKGLMLLVVLVAALVDRAMGGVNSVCRDAVCWFYIANEGLSLLENMSLAGVPFPAKIKELLGQKKGESEKLDGEAVSHQNTAE